mmetsp:Transcript_56989/g.185205  ORF Transcript_56989/g.185205 Transcript_56989/m.185205 type:complete len:289 (+) Transcript_56989:51-917(+)
MPGLDRRSSRRDATALAVAAVGCWAACGASLRLATFLGPSPPQLRRGQLSRGIAAALADGRGPAGFASAALSSSSASSALGALGLPQPPVGRREVSGLAGVLTAVALCLRPARAAERPACGNIDECREVGDRKFAEADREKGPIVRLGQGVRYREVRVGHGAEVKMGDSVDISFEVQKTNGDYIYSLGRGRPDMQGDFGETYRVTLGSHDVPVAVEQAMEGMRAGGVRKVEMPPQLGFQTSEWKPEPSNFSGKQRMERYRKLLTGNGLQAGYNAAILFEVEVIRVRSS